MKVENNDFFLENLKKNLTDYEWDILCFSAIPNILLEDMLFFRFHDKMSIVFIKQTIQKLTMLGIFSIQYTKNHETFFIVHDRIKQSVSRSLDTFFFHSCKILLRYYENYIKTGRIFCKQFYNDKLFCQLVLEDNYEWRSCYQSVMEKGDEFECQKLLDIYKKAIPFTNNILKLWFHYYTFENEFRRTGNDIPVDISDPLISECTNNIQRELWVYVQNIVGLLHLRQNNYSVALQHFEKAIRDANDNEKAIIQYNICITLFHKEKYKQALNLLVAIYNYSSKMETDLFIKIKLNLLHAVLDTRLYNLESAISYFTETIEFEKKYQNTLKTHVPLYLSQKPPHPFCATLDKDIYNYMGEVYLTKGEFRQAIHFHEMGLSCKSIYEDTYGMAWAHNDLGKAYYLSGDTETAKQHLRQSCDLFRQSQHRLFVAYPLLEISYVHQYNGNTKQAIQALKQSVLLFKEKESENDMILALNHLGRLYQSQGFLNLAEKIFMFCLTRLDGTSFIKRTLGWIYNNLARNFLFLLDFDNALLHFKKALDIFQNIYEKMGISYVTNNIAEVKVKQGKYEEAQRLFMLSCQAKEEMGDKHAICYTYRELAELYIKLKQLPMAFSYIEKALSLCNQGNFIMLKGDIWISYGNYYSQKQQYKKAKDFYISALDNYQKQSFFSRMLYCLDKIKTVSYESDDFAYVLPNKESILEHIRFEESVLLETESKLLEKL